jgi:hypothetical protein
MVTTSDVITSGSNRLCRVTAAPAPRQKEIQKMSVDTGTNQKTMENCTKAVRGPMAAASRRGQGMRVGLLDDWRAGGAKATSEIAERGKRLRDGR